MKTYRTLYLEAVFSRMAGPDGDRIRTKAVALTRKWDTVPGTDPYYGRRWRELLDMPIEQMRAIVLAQTEEGERLRHAMPFADVLPPSEREELRRQARSLSHP